MRGFPNSGNRIGTRLGRSRRLQVVLGSLLATMEIQPHASQVPSGEPVIGYLGHKGGRLLPGRQRILGTCALTAMTFLVSVVLSACSTPQRAVEGEVCIEIPASSGESPAEQHPCHSVELKVSEELAIRLGAFGGTGFAWEMAGPVPAVLQSQGGGTVTPTDGRPGAATWTTFRMRAVAQGDASLRFLLRRPWEPVGHHDRQVDIAVTVIPARTHAKGQ